MVSSSILFVGLKRLIFTLLPINTNFTTLLIKTKSRDITMTKHYDYISIGGGSGGIASINRAASYGKKCAIIEANQLGGTCVNLGCVPKKVMWYGAQVAEAIEKYAPDYGFDVEVKGLTFKNWSIAANNISKTFTALMIIIWRKMVLK